MIFKSSLAIHNICFSNSAPFLNGDVTLRILFDIIWVNADSSRAYKNKLFVAIPEERAGIVFTMRWMFTEPKDINNTVYCSIDRLSPINLMLDIMGISELVDV
jgi:hypothetical protein